ncbi:MAG: hypothetical protein R3D44_03975 [Hyphomicrobiaceae bacterium]
MRRTPARIRLQARLACGIFAGLAALPIVAAPPVPALAQESSEERGNLAFGVTGGTLGIGAEAALKLHPNVILRATASGGALSTFFDIGVDDTVFDKSQPYWYGTSQKYEFSPSVMSAGLLLDVHLFRDGGRLTGGFRYLSYTLDSKLTTEGPAYTIGETYYTKQQAGNVTAEVKNGSSILPYIGIGYDSAFFKDYRFSIGIDAGVLIGSSPRVTLNTGPGVSAADKEAEEKKLAKNLDALDYFPVLMMTAKYRF